jgi:aminopeptidase N
MMEYAIINAIYPDWNIWLKFASGEAYSHCIEIGYRHPSGHTPVDSPNEISTLFDAAIVYAKGGRLLNMLRECIGEDDFRSGLSYY